jgi:spermidine dehydrogenase
VTKRDRELGMNSEISRRDFLDGVGVTVGGAMVGSSVIAALGSPGLAAAQQTSGAGQGNYPPALTGLRGQTQSDFEVSHAMRDGKTFDAGEDTGEIYDLVVVGAGMSGLAAAYYFRKKLPETKVLILDNSDDFGGHARRNEFAVNGRQVILNGGTLEIWHPKTFTVEGSALLRDIGIDDKRFYKATEADRNQYREMDLGPSTFFDKETFGADALVKGGLGQGAAAQGKIEDYLAKAPLSQGAKDGLTRMYTSKKDYMPGVSLDEKIQRLRKISYADYLLTVVNVHPDTIKFLQRTSGGGGTNGAASLDSYSAWYAFSHGRAGFEGLGLPMPQISWTKDLGEHIHLPDGNGGVARLLVRWLIPEALPGKTMEDSITSRLNYAVLDKPSNAVRIRLSSSVVRAQHNGDPGRAKEVEVTYVRSGKSYRVKAGACVMACFNAVVPYLCPELPEKQKQALHLSVRKPLAYTSVAIKNWSAFRNLGVSRVNYPGKFIHSSASLDPGASLGDYRRSPTPDDPTVLWLTAAWEKPGLAPRDQFRAGRAELLDISFATFERDIRDQLARSLAAGGFDPARDITGITVNRWAHGYAGAANDLYDPDWSREEVPWVVGRKRLGRIAIANSDAGAICLTQCAFDQANRAVNELLTDVIRLQFDTTWGERV